MLRFPFRGTLINRFLWFTYEESMLISIIVGKLYRVRKLFLSIEKVSKMLKNSQLLLSRAVFIVEEIYQLKKFLVTQLKISNKYFVIYKILVNTWCKLSFNWKNVYKESLKFYTLNKFSFSLKSIGHSLFLSN